jgi:diguanylate cyclase (GGDEF)-like protein
MNFLFFTYFILIVCLTGFRKYWIAASLAFCAICHMSFAYAKQSFPVSPFLVFLLGILFFGCCIYLLYRYNRSLQGELDQIQGDSVKMEEQFSALKDKDGFLLDRNAQLEKSLSEIVTIYEYVKKLSSTMDFIEAIKILNETMRSLVQFSSGKLIAIENQEIAKIYCIASEEVDKNIKVSALEEYETNIISKIIKNPQILIFEKGKLTSLGQFPPRVNTLLAVPLLVEKRIVAIIMLENIQLANTDKIHFIALQFAMEVKKAQLYGKVKELSKIDSLTQLYLRRHFMNLLENELDRGFRQSQPMSFLMLDVDYFKRYNDEYGHLVGDLILKKVASVLRDKSREIDLLCRYGGDEFALALPRTNLQDAYTVAERLRRAVSEHLFHVSKEQFQISISIGITICDPKDMEAKDIAERIIDLADKALYEAKALGRNKVVVVGPS